MKNKSRVILGDCLKKLKDIETNSFDHCITDPPYNISNYSGKKQIGWYKSNPTWKDKKKFIKIDEKWDTFSDDDYYNFTLEWMKEIFRIVKPNGNLLIFGTYHNIYKIGYILSKEDKRIVNSIIWYKRNAFPNITLRMLCESTEQIIWSVNNSNKKSKNWVFNYNEMKKLTENKKQMRNMWDIPMTSISEKRFGKHPSQKPIEVIDRLVKGCTNKNEKIIDPFSGSGTVPLVCAMNKRQYLGIEKDKEYHKISMKRLKNLK